MEDDLCLLLFILIGWLILYIILEFRIINKYRKNVSKQFNSLNESFEKRLALLNKMIDIVKSYDANQFDKLGSKLYDYTRDYNNYEFNEKLRVNEYIDREVKKLLLTTKVYPELNDFSKYIKLEKSLIRIEKVLKKLKIKYNKSICEYNNRKKIFPTSFLCSIFNFYVYDYYDLNKG